MIVKLNSYINLNGNAKEAAEFYKSVFGGELFIDTFARYADTMPVQDEDKDKVMHAYLKGDNGIELMLSDTPSGMPYTTGSQITLALNGDDDAKLRAYWSALSQGGKITMPLEAAPWGDSFGMLVDKYGITWMVDIGKVQ